MYVCTYYSSAIFVSHASDRPPATLVFADPAARGQMMAKKSRDGEEEKKNCGIT